MRSNAAETELRRCSIQRIEVGVVFHAEGRITAASKLPPQQTSLPGTPVLPPQQTSLPGTPVLPPQQTSLLGTPVLPPQQTSLPGTPLLAGDAEPGAGTQIVAWHESSKIRGGSLCLRCFLSAHAQSQQAAPIA